jgi:hypothetical protein
LGAETGERSISGNYWLRAYLAGYALYVLLVAAWAWPQLPFDEWLIYTGSQVVYGLAWPILLLLMGLSGLRW